MAIQHISIAIFGSSGNGKSYLGLYLIENMHRLKKYTIIYDPKGEYRGLTRIGFREAVFTEELIRRLTPESAVLIMQKNPKLLIRGMFLNFEERQYLVECFASASLALGNTLFVVEEASTILTNIYNPNQRYTYSISTEGRTFGVDSIFIFQRLAMVSKITLSQCNTYISFNITEPNDALRVASIMGIRKEEVTSLRPREYLYMEVSNGQVKKMTTKGLKLKTKHYG